MAEVVGNVPVSALLETNLASRMVFIERTKRLTLELGEAAMGGRRAA